MTYYLVVFATGFVGSFHCIGMCGGFACALGRDPRGGVGATMLRHLLYNSGRLTTYCFLGVLAGALGQILCTQQGMTVTLLGGSLDAAERILAIVAGLLMIAMALQFFGVLRAFHRLAIGFASSTFATSLRSLLTTHNRAAPLAFGVFNGLLPCRWFTRLRPKRRALAKRSRRSHHGVVWTGNLPGDADDRRRRAGTRACVAAAWCLAGRQFHLASWPYHPRPWHPAFRRAHRTWLAGRSSSVTARGDMICSHCLLPLGLRAMERKVNGENCAFCCYGCCIAFQVKNGKSEEWEAAWLLIRLGIGGFLSMNIMLFSLLLYTDAFTGADARLVPWVHILLWIFATPAVIILGRPFLHETWLNGLQGRLTSSALIVIGVGAAYLYSAFAVIERGHHVYFDTATMVLILFTLGRLLEAAGRARAARDLEPLLAAERESVVVVQDGMEVRRPVREIEAGMLVRVRPGERIAIDGVVVEGESHFDEAVITGESRLVTKAVGSPVVAGSINLDGPLLIQSSMRERQRVGPRFADRFGRRSSGAARASVSLTAWLAPRCPLFWPSAG